jgi:malate synthase
MAAHNEVVIEGGRTFNMTLYKDIFDDEVEKSSPNLRENIKTASLN